MGTYIENELRDKLVAKINEIYIGYRKKFLIMYPTGEYKTVTENNLSDGYIKRHLNGKQTIGVFAGSQFSKFICFDVDVKDKELAKHTTYRVYHSLSELGIPEEKIYISYSGSKGYHIEIFFDKLINNKDINQFYLMVLNNADLLNIDYGDVELRPLEKNGVKIPLGTHFKTGNTCWYVNYGNGLQPIKDYKYLLTIEQLDSEYFYAILNKLNDSIDLTDNQINEFENIKEKHKPLDIYKQNIDEDYTYDAIEKLIQTGLLMQGSRHNSLLKISKYLKYNGYSIEDNKSLLIKWMSNQDKSLYTTSWEDCLKDIDSIVDWIYENNCLLTIRNFDISVHNKEIEQIMNIKGKNEKLLLYSMLIHSKRYSTKDNIFYMTYTQMEEVTGLDRRTTIRLIKKLEENDIIKVTRSNIVKYNKKLSKPTSESNRYKINLLSDKNNINDKEFKVCDRNCTGCFYVCLCNMYSNNELKNMFSRDQYDNIKEFRVKDYNNYSCTKCI